MPTGRLRHFTERRPTNRRIGLSSLVVCLVVCVLCASCAPTSPPPVAPTPAPTQAVATPDARTVTLAAVGDVMLGRYVGRRIDALGTSYPFSATEELLRADLLVGNLESPPTSRRTPGALRPGPYRLPADPAVVAGLRDAGFRAVSLANNHALDAGPAGLAEAASVVAAAGIAPLGVGADRADALRPHIVEANGLRIALLAANDVADPADQPDEEQGWGRAPLDAAFLEAVRTARQHADLVIVLVHWGVEYAPAPGLRQRDQGAALVEAGADVVLGAHPHVVQPISVIDRGERRALIAYSLGNFVFDQPFSPETSRSAVAQITLGRNGVQSYRAAPVAIVDGQPRPLATDDPAAAAVQRDLGLTAPDVPTPTAVAPTTHHNTASSYRWNGQTFAPTAQPQGIPPFASASLPFSATVDLRGDGGASLMNVDVHGLAELHQGATADTPVVWRNESPTWRVASVVAGDADDDGRFEFLLILWKPDAAGVLRCHPFLVGWRGGRYRVFWGGSAVNEPIQAAALGDVDADGRTELVVLEGGSTPDAAATSVAVWRWHGWGFERLWRSPVAGARHLLLAKPTNDETRDIVVGNDP